MDQLGAKERPLSLPTVPPVLCLVEMPLADQTVTSQRYPDVPTRSSDRRSYRLDRWRARRREVASKKSAGRGCNLHSWLVMTASRPPRHRRVELEDRDLLGAPRGQWLKRSML